MDEEAKKTADDDDPNRGGARRPSGVSSSCLWQLGGSPSCSSPSSVGGDSEFTWDTDSDAAPGSSADLSRGVVQDENSNVTKEQLLETSPLLRLRGMTDVGLYSYAALCAFAFRDLFSNSWDRPFIVTVLQQIVDHLGLPEQVKAVMVLMTEGHGADSPDPYIDLLMSEPVLGRKGLIIIEDLVLFAVREGVYDSRMRTMIKHVAWMLRVEQDLVEMYEESVVDFLNEEEKELSEDDKKEIERQKRNKKIRRYALIGLATLGGGAVVGLTGGLAAPLIGAGVGTILGGTSAALLSSTAGIAVISSLFGVAGAGLTGYKMKKRVGDIEEFAFDSLTDGAQLHITIAVNGWLNESGRDAIKKPWRSLYDSREQYCLRYESEYLLELGKAIDYMITFALSVAAQEALKYTILSGLISAVTWPTSLLTLASVIDNPWGVCCRRSADVGKQLAMVLMSRQQGGRPVTLIGFSLGARVIFYCLRELCQKKGTQGILQDAIMLGTPVSGNPKDWECLSQVVAGRIVNGYCRGDWLLKFLYRTSSVSSQIAGLQPVRWDDRRMCNVDLSDVVTGHMDYSRNMDIILKAIGIRTRDEVIISDHFLKRSVSEFPFGHYSCWKVKTSSSVPLRKSSSDSILCRPGTRRDVMCPTGQLSGGNRLRGSLSDDQIFTLSQHSNTPPPPIPPVAVGGLPPSPTVAPPPYPPNWPRPPVRRQGSRCKLVAQASLDSLPEEKS